MRWSLLNRKEANHFVIISLPPAQVYCSNNKFLLMRTCKQEAQMLFDLMKAGYITAADWLTDISQIYKIQLQAHQSLINRRMVGTLTTAATKLDEIITNQSDVESVKSSKPRSSKEDNDSGIEISDDVYGQDTLSVSSKQLASVRVMQMRYNTKLDDETSSRSRSDSKGDESVNPTFVNHAQVVNLLDQLLSCAPATHVTKPTTINNSTMRSSSSTLQTHKMSVNTAGNTNKQQEYHWRQDASDPLPPPIHLPMTSTSSTKPPHEGFHTISQISSLDSDCRELHMSHVDVQDVWQSQQMEVEPMKGSVSGKKHSRQLTLDLSSIDRASRPRISSHPSIPMGSLAYALKSTDENYEIMDLSQFDVFHPLDCKLMLQRHLFTGIPDHVEGDTNRISTSNSSEVGTNSTFVVGSSRLVAAAHTFVNALRFSKQFPDKILCEVADVTNQKQPARVNKGTVEDENKSIVCNLKQVKIHYKYFLLELTPSDIEDFE